MPRKKKRIDHHPIVGEFAQRLRAARRRLGLSQYDLAIKSGMALTYCGKLERAECAAGIDTVARLAEVLGVSAASLVGGRIQPEPDPETVGNLLTENTAKLLRKPDKEIIGSLAVLTSALTKRR